MRSAANLTIPGICGMGMCFQIDGFRLVYLGIAVLMWVVSGVFSLEYMAHYEKRNRYYCFFLATFFATVGVFLSADFYLQKDTESSDQRYRSPELPLPHP